MHYAKTTMRRTNVRIVSTSDPSSAARKPWTRKPGVNIDASFNRSALITSGNSPSVRKISGNAEKSEDRAEEEIHDGDHGGGDQRRAEIADLDAGNDLRHQPERERAQQPVHDEVQHIASRQR